MTQEELEAIKEAIKEDILSNLSLDYDSNRDWDSPSIYRRIMLKYKDQTISTVSWYAQNS